MGQDPSRNPPQAIDRFRVRLATQVDRTRSTRFPPRSWSLSTPAETATWACWTTSRVTRFTRATGDCFFARAGERRLAAEPRFLAPFRALARILRLRAEPRFLADRVAFFADAFLAFVAMDLSSNRDRDDGPQQDSGNTAQSALLRAGSVSTMNAT